MAEPLPHPTHQKQSPTRWRPSAFALRSQGHVGRHAKLMVAKFTQHHIEMMDPEKSSVAHMRDLTAEGVSIEEARKYLGCAAPSPSRPPPPPSTSMHCIKSIHTSGPKPA